MSKTGLFLVFAAAFCAFGSDPISKDEYRTRRAELRKKLDGGLVLFGWSEGHDPVYRTPQGTNFHYLTGWTEPGAILLITPTEDKLFIPNRNERVEIYNGHRSAPVYVLLDRCKSQRKEQLVAGTLTHPCHRNTCAVRPNTEKNLAVILIVNRQPRNTSQGNAGK